MKAFIKLEKKENYKNKLPWVDRKLKSMIKQKNSLYVKWIKYKTQINFKCYKQYKTMVTRELKGAKRDYQYYKIKRAQNSIKKQWDVINEMLGKTKNESIPKIPWAYEGEIKNRLQLANAFNKYFANIGRKLEQTIPNTTINYSDYMGPSNEQTMFLEPVCIEEIIPILKNILTNAAGIDNISKTIIKDKFHIIASFLEGIVPIDSQ